MASGPAAAGNEEGGLLDPVAGPCQIMHARVRDFAGVDVTVGQSLLDPSLVVRFRWRLQPPQTLLLGWQHISRAIWAEDLVYTCVYSNYGLLGKILILDPIHTYIGSSRLGILID